MRASTTEQQATYVIHCTFPIKVRCTIFMQGVRIDLLSAPSEAPKQPHTVLVACCY
jgi:hypothetical protein